MEGEEDEDEVAAEDLEEAEEISDLIEAQTREGAVTLASAVAATDFHL